MVEQFILHNNPNSIFKEKRGVEWTDSQYLKLMKVCYLRNTTLYKKLVKDYEFLTGKTFKKEWLEGI